MLSAKWLHRLLMLLRHSQRLRHASAPALAPVTVLRVVATAVMVLAVAVQVAALVPKTKASRARTVVQLAAARPTRNVQHVADIRLTPSAHRAAGTTLTRNVQVVATVLHVRVDAATQLAHQLAAVVHAAHVARRARQLAVAKL